MVISGPECDAVGRTEDLVLVEWVVVLARPAPAGSVDVLSLACTPRFSGRRLLSVSGCGAFAGCLAACFRSFPAGITGFFLICLSLASG